MLWGLIAKYHIRPAILLLSTEDDLAPPGSPPKTQEIQA
jgi:hypothetical protein